MYGVGEKCSGSNGRGWHLARGFDDVGYHYFIRKNGTLEYGRDLDKIPAAQKGYNRGSIAICLSGRNDFKEEQFVTLRKLIKNMNYILKPMLKKDLKIRLHNEVNKRKTCPNFDLDRVWLKP